MDCFLDGSPENKPITDAFYKKIKKCNETPQGTSFVPTMGWHKGRVCPHDPVRPVCTRASPTRSARRRRTPGAGRLRGLAGMPPGAGRPAPEPAPAPVRQRPPHLPEAASPPAKCGGPQRPPPQLPARKEGATHTKRARQGLPTPDGRFPGRHLVVWNRAGWGRWEEVRHVESLRPPLFAHLGGWTLRLSALRSGAGGITATWLATRTAPWRSREF